MYGKVHARSLLVGFIAAVFLAGALGATQHATIAWALEAAPFTQLQYGEFDVSGVLQDGGFLTAADTESAEQPSTGELGIMATPNIEGFNKALHEAVESWKGEASKTVNIAAYNIPTNQINDLFGGFINENGQYFYLSSKGVKYAYSSATVASITIPFNTSYTSSDRSAFDAVVQSVTSGVETGWSDEQKALYLHDWIVTHCQYDTSYSKHSAYDALVKGSAVCQGYTLAYDYLLSLVGVESTPISSNKANHIWNMVTIDGQPYYVDSTLDDPLISQNDSYYAAYCGHAYFLRSKDGLIKIGSKHHSYTDWIDAQGNGAFANSKATSSKYEQAYWSKTITAVPHAGSQWAYVKKTSRETVFDIWVHDYASSTDKLLAQGIPGKWTVWGSPSRYYPDHFSSIVSDGEAFVVSTPTALYKITASGSTSQAYTLSSNEQQSGFIYGLLYDREKGQCIYHIATSPQSNAKTMSGTYSLPYKGPSQSVKNGSIHVVSNNTYQVISASAHTVALAKAKNAANVAVPATVSIAGTKYKVTQVKASAFANSKATKATIGSNVTKIAKNAFAKSKVKQLTIASTKLTKASTVKGSLAGSKITTIIVKIGTATQNKQYVKKYKKVFTAANAGKAVTVK